MMMPRCRDFILIKNSIVASTSAAAHSAGFHSTPVACQKWRSKFDSDFDKDQQKKNYIRYATRQKFADAKKALKDLIFRSGSPNFFSDPIWKFDGTATDPSRSGAKKPKSKHSSPHTAKNHCKKMKRNVRRESFAEDFEGQPETIFHAKFGDRFYSWSYISEYFSCFGNPAFGFEWREQASAGNQRTSSWESISDMESDGEEDVNIGSSSPVVD